MNSDNEVFSESLAYPQVKKRATASRSYRVKIPSSNGTNFSPGQTINIDLPSNQAGTYANMNQAYLKFTVNYTAQAAILDRNGAYNFIKRLSIQTAGAMLTDIQNYNVLTCAMMDMQSSHDWKASSGKQLIGCYGDSLRGESQAVNTSRTYCIPLILNCLSNTTPHRLIPLFSLSNLQLRFQLESAAAAYTSAAGGAYTVSEVEYVAMLTELSPASQAKVDAMTNGDYNILALNFMNATASQAVAQSSVTANLGFSMSSLERIIVCHRKVNAAIGTPTVFSNSRVANGLDQFNFLINSQQYPDRPIMISSDREGAEVWAETLISDHRLNDFTRGCPINTGLAKIPFSSAGTSDLSGSDPAAVKINSYLLADGDALGTTAGAAGGAPNAVAAGTATASNIGTFICSAEFESGLSDGKSSHIYSGISTIGSTVQYVGAYTGAPSACQIDFFAVYTVLLNLNMRGLGTWQVRV